MNCCYYRNCNSWDCNSLEIDRNCSYCSSCYSNSSSFGCRYSSSCNSSSLFGSLMVTNMSCYYRRNCSNSLEDCMSLSCCSYYSHSSWYSMCSYRCCCISSCNSSWSPSNSLRMANTNCCYYRNCSSWDCNSLEIDKSCNYSSSCYNNSSF